MNLSFWVLYGGQADFLKIKIQTSKQAPKICSKQATINSNSEILSKQRGDKERIIYRFCKFTKKNNCGWLKINISESCIKIFHITPGKIKNLYYKFHLISNLYYKFHLISYAYNFQMILSKVFALALVILVVNAQNLQTNPDLSDWTGGASPIYGGDVDNSNNGEGQSNQSGDNQNQDGSSQYDQWYEWLQDYQKNQHEGQGDNQDSNNGQDPVLQNLNGILADTIYLNGDIMTLEAETFKQAKYVSYLAVKNGTIIYAGNSRRYTQLVGPNTAVIDLNGSTLLPGFIDSHSHLSTAALVQDFANLFASPEGSVNNFADVVTALTTWAGNNAAFIATTGWIVGFGYDNSLLQEVATPDKTVLDQVSTTVPIFIVHASGHQGVMNSAGLAICNLTSATPDPTGGKYDRYPNSTELTGVMEESALMYWENFILTKVPAAMSLGALIKGQSLYASQGYTTIQQGYSSAGTVGALVYMASKNLLYLDVMSYVPYPNIPLLSVAPYSGFVNRQNYTNHLRIAGVKVYLDGSIQIKTGWLSEAYYVGLVPGVPYFGYGQWSLPDLQTQVNAILGGGYHLIAHVNGDAAIQQFIDAVTAYRLAQSVNITCDPTYSNLDNLRITAIHSQTSTYQQLDQMVNLKIIPSFFGEHTFYWGDWHYTQTLGPERASRISPAGSAILKNMVFTQHTDAPVTLINTTQIMWTTVNRLTRSGRLLGSWERIDPYHALLSLTRYASYQISQENSKGTLTVGKRADLVILSQNPIKTPPLQLNQIRIKQTIKDGKTVYAALV